MDSSRKIVLFYEGERKSRNEEKIEENKHGKMSSKQSSQTLDTLDFLLLPPLSPNFQVIKDTSQDNFPMSAFGHQKVHFQF